MASWEEQKALLKEKLDDEIHRFALPPEEVPSGSPYFEKLRVMLSVKDELLNIPLCGAQYEMLLGMEDPLDAAFRFWESPAPDTCAARGSNFSETTYYFLLQEGEAYRGGLLYDRANAEFDALLEELKGLPPEQIIDRAYEKVIKEDLLILLEPGGLEQREIDALLTFEHPLAALYGEWMDRDTSYMDLLRQTCDDLISFQEKQLRHHAFDKEGEVPEHLRDYYLLYGEEIENSALDFGEDLEL